MKNALVAVILLIGSISFANRESGGRLGASAVYVDFRSFGTGIDQFSKQTFDNLVAAAKYKGVVLDETYQQNGREGEILACVKLTDAYERYSFIRSLAPHIIADRDMQGVQRTSVFVGFDCHSFESATDQDLTKYLVR